MSTTPRIDELRKKFEENPRRYFAPLANELRKAGELAEAISLCREHLPKQPGHMSGHIVFGQALYESGELDEARSVFEAALALDPENLIALRHLGDIARQLGDASAARRWYERVLDADPRNDDIAAQLATLAAVVTPVSAAAVTPAGVTPIADEDVAARLFAPSSSIAAADLAPIDVPDLDELPALSPLQAAAAVEAPKSSDPVLFDLDAIEAASDDASNHAPAGESAAADPFFGHAVTEPVAAPVADVVAAAEAEAAFEEGFVAADWPDTSDLAERAATPRSATPIASPAVAVDAEVVEAFGREAHDVVDAVLPEPEPEWVDVEVAVATDDNAVVAANDDNMTADADNAPDIVAEWDADSDAVSITETVAEIVTEPTAEIVAETVTETAAEPVAEIVAESTVETVETVAEHDEVVDVIGGLDIQVGTSILDFEDPADQVETDDAVSAELPWLAAPVTPSEDVVAIVEAFAEDARAKGESDDVAVVEMPAPMAAFVDEAHVEASFEGMLSTDSELPPADDDVAEPAGPAFVTETMGELLVSQGFLDRAITVYEELVRRRPFDPVPVARLAELREQQQALQAPPVAASFATPARPAAAVLLTARERFAALAARTVERRTPSHSAAVSEAALAPTPRYVTPVSAPHSLRTPAHVTPITGIPAEDTLASLFGAASTSTDDAAAQSFANAFSGVASESASESFFGSGSMTAISEPTPASPVAAQQEQPAAGAFAFDRFFPDPATTAPVAPSSPTPSASPAMPGAESKAADDLAQFSAWLKGLGNP